MNPAFEELVDKPWNQIFNVVFFPDRVYHAQYLNATRSVRYRYNVTEVRGKADILVMKGEVYLDGLFFTNFLRIEYRASRLVEAARERGRFVRGELTCDLTALPSDPSRKGQARAKLRYCPWIDAYQVEIWRSLEPPHGRHHDYQVLDMIGVGGSITRLPALDAAIGENRKDLRALRQVVVWFEENEFDQPAGYFNNNRAFDDYYNRNIQVPITQDPSSDRNTVGQRFYGVDFSRGWFVRRVGDLAPVRYRNAMMNDQGPERGNDNVIEMRWVFQQEFAGSNVFFHEVTIPPGTVEGTHQHIGSEELYYIYEGQGTAYLGEDDSAEPMDQYPRVERDMYGVGTKWCREVPVAPGSVIFTKSGGIHGIRNDGSSPLRFVAFLYHSS